MKDPRKYADNEIATQHNDVVFGRQTFSVLQKRLYLLAVAQIERGDQQLHPYQVNVRDVVQAGTSKSIYDRLDELTDQLMRKIFKRRIRDEMGNVIGWEKWPMIDYAKHIEGEGVIEIDFHPRMEELLLNLQEHGHFTPVPTVNQIACTSSYGQRIYAMLYSWRRKGKMDISVKELREALDLQDKYKNFSHFRSYVLKKAQKDLKKHTNMRFTWEEEKRGRGRKITDLVFEFEFVADQMDLPMEIKKEEEKEPEFDIKFNLADRLKNNAKLAKKELGTVLEWLDKNEGQQWPIACWLSAKVECQRPEDALGNPIREMDSWAWDKIKKAMHSGGFPEPEKSPEEAREINPEAFENDVPGHDPNNPFNDMRPE
ncbi:RepB family plasmid replication initiator protein [Candidatus Saccharibacteria bacterium]|nr:RepB family plasmid replication initiator protein [Candidatus Saccharibacteria bacterium]NIW80904.1 RepB family plasmid replication initiator protein [Calditrichia bacterium]